MISAAGTMAIAVTSCDDVKEGDRYIDMGEIKAERNVLIEDFTGQSCSNCPMAHEAIEQLEEQYGDKVIAVSIHCGSLSIPKFRSNFETGYIGLMTTEGNTIMSSYSVNQWPMGSVNGSGPMNYPLWAEAVRKAIEIPTDVKLDLAVEYEPGDDGKTGTIKMSADVLSSEAMEASIQFWIVESGIVTEQKLPDNSINKTYVHNNVFRAMVYDSLNGKDISLAAGMAEKVNAEIITRWNNEERWQAENLAVVAFVKAKGSVQQVVRVPVIADNSGNE